MASKLRVPRVSLANLSPARGSQQNQKRVGRGQGSGYGGTSGRGMNGQKSRSGAGIKRNFEGGQTPITKLFPKRGFINQNAKTWAPINLDRLQHWIDQGKITSSPENPITARELLLSGCVHDVHNGIKLLGDGSQHLRSQVYMVVSRASTSAIEAIEAQGGKVVCQYYNTLALHDCVKGRTDRTQAAPTRRSDIVWYGKHQNRGYLASETLKTLGDLPFVQDRWRQLSTELNKWKKQDFDKERKKAG
ncbi:50s ribosomal protein l15 [Moniliophthora roreri MCA 2997]|uniref:50s ribosomal protein l15 n=2 Tax=Moniliophthora roreri TaxID=221103 RepID=V2XSU4_MONRO|nr:50s ribosomal protein l15 [Moniliophthora roreri MCA 2997]KAI3613591.1 50s ribosomal protein l15 [Moniliophthora roreri]